jgi:hypothetical protein
MYFLQELLTWANNARVSSVIDKRGSPLSLYADVNVTASGVADKDVRSFRATAPLSVSGCLDITVCEAVGDNSGLNTRFASESNSFDFNVWATEAAGKLVHDRRVLIERLETARDMRNSEVGLIYNLLRQYLLLSIEGPVLQPESDYYNDGHLAVTYGQAFSMVSHERWGLIPDQGRDGKVTEGGGSANYLGWTGMTSLQATVLATALGGLTGVPGVPLMASSKRLISVASFGASVNMNLAEEYWNEAAGVLMTLKLLVEKGRLYNQFDTALNLLAQTGCHVRAPVVEAVPLCASDHSLPLPAFSSFRFYLTGCCEGPMGGVRPSAMATYRAFCGSPNSFWIYAAIMRSAAEFRGCTTYGTDFDTSGTFEGYVADIGVTGLLGRWQTLAASSLGKTFFIQPDLPLGASLANYEKPVALRVVGDLRGLNIVEDVGQGSERRVRIAIWNDERRQALHSRLLFALGVLPKSKVGQVVTKATLVVEHSNRPDKVCRVRGEHVGAYLTMCRAHGWDASVDIAPGRVLNSWSDNQSRMNWTSDELDYYGGAWFHVSSVTWRGEPLNKQKIFPAMAGTYAFEMSMPRVGMLYDYSQPITTGTGPARGVLLETSTRREVAMSGGEIELHVPEIRGSAQDFGEVLPLTGQLAPPMQLAEATVPLLDPGPEATAAAET